MEYTFKKTDYSFGTIKNKKITYDYGVIVHDKKINALELIESYIWTPEKVQELIDDALALQGEQRLEYQVDGGHLGIVIFANEVYFFDLLSEKEEEDFIWSLDKFISFLEDFKKFIEENS